MAQHDLNIANDAGNVVRADINSALVALGTQQSGTAAPAGPSAGWRWMDTNTPSATVWTESVYDGADWIERGRIDTTNNRYLAAGAPIWGAVAGGTANALTVTNNLAPAARFPGQRWSIIAASANTGAATLNDNAIGAVAIVRPDGAALLARDLLAGHQFEVVWDGTSWRLTDWPDTKVLIGRASASASATLPFSLSGSFTDYELEFSGVRLSADAATLCIQSSVNSGATYALTAGDYINTPELTRAASGDVLSFNAPSASFVQASSQADIGNPAVTINGKTIFTTGYGSTHPWFRTESSAYEDTIGIASYRASSVRVSTTAINGIRLLASSGNIDSGNFRLYGVR